MSSTARAAIELTALNLPVFPCRADKSPATPHGFKDASTGAQDVARMWRAHPGPLIGVPTGAASGIAALDIDPRHGGDAWLARNGARLPETRTHVTQSGGWHMLFTHSPGVRNSASKIAPGIDVRGDGGYVIWWPAAGLDVQHAATLAAWPSWLRAVQLPPQPPPPPPRRNVVALQGDTARRAARIIAATLARLELAPPGQRHERLRAAARTLGGLADVAGFSDREAETALYSAVLRAGGADIRESNARKTIRWGLERGRAAPLAMEAR